MPSWLVIPLTNCFSENLAFLNLRQGYKAANDLNSTHTHIQGLYSSLTHRRNTQMMKCMKMAQGTQILAWEILLEILHRKMVDSRSERNQNGCQFNQNNVVPVRVYLAWLKRSLDRESSGGPSGRWTQGTGWAWAWSRGPTRGWSPPRSRDRLFLQFFIVD